MGEYIGKRAKTREQLLQAGMAVVSQHGVANFAISDVAARAGVVAATFYNHFDHREQFVAALARHLASDVHLGVAAIEALEDDPAGRVALATLGIVRRSQVDREFGAAFVAFASTATDLSIRLRELTRTIVLQGVECGRFDIEVDDGALDATVNALVGATVSAVQAAVVGTATKESAITSAVLMLKLLGLGKAEATQAVDTARRVGAANR